MTIREEGRRKLESPGLPEGSTPSQGTLRSRREEDDKSPFNQAAAQKRTAAASDHQDKQRQQRRQEQHQPTCHHCAVSLRRTPCSDSLTLMASRSISSSTSASPGLASGPLASAGSCCGAGSAAGLAFSLTMPTRCQGCSESSSPRLTCNLYPILHPKDLIHYCVQAAQSSWIRTQV